MNTVTNLTRLASGKSRTLKERFTEETGIALDDAYWSNNGATVTLPRNCSTDQENAARIAEKTGLQVTVIGYDKYEVIGY